MPPPLRRPSRAVERGRRSASNGPPRPAPRAEELALNAPVRIDYDPTREALLRPCGRNGSMAAVPVPADDASVCAELARLAYCHAADADGRAPAGAGAPRASPARLPEPLRQMGFTASRFVSVGSTQALLATGERRAVLAFRGTQPPSLRPWRREPAAPGFEDITTDLRARLVPSRHADGRVHEGFALALDQAWGEIHSLLPPAGRLLLTGHSLGAALATLAAARCAGRAGLAVHAFGSPRVGDGRFAAAIAAVELHRYVGCCDVVCRLPPRWLGYRHAGRLHYIDRHGTVHADSAAGWRADRWRARLQYLAEHAWRRGTVAARGLADHAPINYVSAVAGLRPGQAAGPAGAGAGR